MRSIRTIIVDDEVLGRSRVRNLLQTEEQIQCVGEGKNGEEAIKLIQDYKPDLVLLDVEMPGKMGSKYWQVFQKRKGHSSYSSQQTINLRSRHLMCMRLILS